MIKKNSKLLGLIPAVLLFLFVFPVCSVFIGVQLDNILMFPIYLPYLINGIAATFFIFPGLYLCGSSIKILITKGKGYPWGPVREKDQSIQLITTGLYKYTRNPMYLGFIFVLIGAGALVNSISSTFINPIIITIIILIIFKKIEEPKLIKRFGKEYLDYQQQTPILIPNPFKKK